ncbi:hypothetical protein ACVWYG_001159, partial [Pedobacter sp. UYEF25]
PVGYPEYMALPYFLHSVQTLKNKETGGYIFYAA